ncbi:MAG: MEMAR_RS02690 family S-layer glycoprotein [Methanoregulaceae archaeon]
MTKRLTMTLVALAVFILFAVLPVSATMLPTGSPLTGLFNGSVIYSMPQLATVFIGESGLNLTPVMAANIEPFTIPAAGGSTKLGWWAPGSQPGNPPSQIIDVGTQLTNFYVDPNVFGQYTGTWYCITAAGTQSGAAFIVADPSQAIAAIDVAANQGTGQDMTGGSVVRGTVLTFKLSSNLAAFTQGGRYNNFSVSGVWSNGTFIVQPIGMGSNFFTTGLTTDGFWNFANGTTIVPPTAIGAGTNVLTWTNFSTFTQNVYGPMVVTHTMFYNNTIGPLGGGTIQGGLNLTTDNAGTLPIAYGGIVLPNTVPVVYSNTTSAVDGFISVKLKDSSGQVQTRVFSNTPNGVSAGAADGISSLSYLWVTTQPWYFPGGATAFTGANGLNAAGWDTGATDPATGMVVYPAGTYTVWTTTSLSHIADNYLLNGAAYTGKAVSASGTVTLVSDTVKIEANKDTVVRSNPFSVTITGKPLTTYVVWVKGTSSMTGAYDNQPPMIGLFQGYVYNDTPSTGKIGVRATDYPIGSYVYQNAALGWDIRADVATDSDMMLFNNTNSTRYYALVNLSSAGTRTVQFETTNWTKAQQYTIRVSRDSTANAPLFNPTPSLRQYKEDEVTVNVVKGAVTITAAGDQSYYLGEDVKFSGTNTESQNTFIFLTGPNLWPAGSIIDNQDPRRSNVAGNSQVIDGNTATFHVTPVNGDNTWSWTWGTSNYALDAGTYTVYAVSGPHDALHLDNVAYGTVSIIVKKPFVSATASQSVVAQGDSLWVTGTAEGKPTQGVAIWIMGKNFATRVTESVASDASFSHEITKAQTTGMDAGQYFIVVQHPMQNQVFDIDLITAAGVDQGWVVNRALRPQGAGTYTKIFQLLGASSLQGTDAANALAQAINDPNVDDTYTKLQYLVEVPVIRIDPVGDRHVGDKFSITATTNLAVDDDVLFQVYSSSFKPTEKTQSGEFSGASGTVKVTAGNTGLNQLSFDVDASTFKPDEYIVQADRVLQPKATATALFNVLEGAAPTAVPTAVGPTAAATTAAVATTVPPTAQPTPTKTPTQPGFGALVALIGLGAVAFLVVRRH